MLQRTLDLSLDFAAAQNVKLDISGWDYITVEAVTPSAQINFNTSDDPGGVTGITDGNALTSKNYQPVALTNTATGQTATSTSGGGIFKGNVIGRFFQLVAVGGTTVNTLIVSLSKIS